MANEESLREAACVGNLEELNELIGLGHDINSTNKVNGWTALHWATKRGHVQAVELLLEAGADKTIQNTSGEKPADLTRNEKIRSLLGAAPLEAAGDEDGHGGKSQKFIPNYIANPEFLYSKTKHQDTSQPLPSNCSYSTEDGFLFCPSCISCTKGNQWSPSGLVLHPDFLVLCVRLENFTKTKSDFIEVEISRQEVPSLARLTSILCEALDMGIKLEHVQKIRKLPRTVLRNDRDVIRLTDYQLLEIVLQPLALHPLNGALVPSARSSGEQPDAHYLKEHVSKLIY